MCSVRGKVPPWPMSLRGGRAASSQSRLCCLSQKSTAGSCWHQPRIDERSRQAGCCSLSIKSGKTEVKPRPAFSKSTLQPSLSGCCWGWGNTAVTQHEEDPTPSHFLMCAQASENKLMSGRVQSEYSSGKRGPNKIDSCFEFNT